jgi:transposase-like protein
MAQHFLLSAKPAPSASARSTRLARMPPTRRSAKMRWPETNGEAVCPKCGHDEAYSITTRRKFKCKACHHQFSVTSGTIFASRKMAFVDLLAAICITVNAAKGVSMVQLSRDLDCQYKTAFVLAHKLREAMAQEVHTGEVLAGHVEIDGAFFGGHIRPENRKEDRKDRRLKRAPDRQAPRRVALRERVGRTLPFVSKQEAEGVALALENVCRTATMSADEASHWDDLHNGWTVDRVNHSLPTATTASTPTWSKATFAPAPHGRRAAPPRQPAVPLPVRQPSRMAGGQPPHRQRDAGGRCGLVSRVWKGATPWARRSAACSGGGRATGSGAAGCRSQGVFGTQMSPRPRIAFSWSRISWLAMVARFFP